MPRTNRRSELRARFAWWIKRGSGIIFDAVHGVDTRVGGSADNLEIASANIGKGVAYDTCPWSTLRRSLGLVSLRPDGYIFVDIGSGKGKVVLSAIVLPFEQVVGIDFSSYLSRVAERNVAAARFIHRRCLSVQLICADAVQYQIPDRPAVFFFANPFHYDIMKLVLDNIVASYLKGPRSIFLMFYGISTIMPQINEFLTAKSGGSAQWRVSTTLGLGQRSVNIFELPPS